MKNQDVRTAGWLIAPALTVAAVIGVLFAKSPAMFLDPRFFGEEATMLLPKFLYQPFIESLQNRYLGSFLFLTNISVALSAMVPLRYAPAVTTYIALAVQVVVAYQIGVFIREYRVKVIPALLLVVGFCLQWGMYEIALSATNVQWVTGISALLILVMPADLARKHALLISAWLILCGISGVPATILAPAFLLRFWDTNQRVFLLFCGVLGACALLQLSFILNSGAPGRHFYPGLGLLLFPPLLQVFIEPIVGPETVSLVGTYIQVALPHIGTLGLGIILTAGGLAAAVVFSAWDRSRWRLIVVLALTGCYVSVIQTLVALQQPTLMTAAGSRYFVVGVTSVLLLCALGSVNTDRSKRAIATGILTVIVLGGISQFAAGTWNSYFMTGPSWSSQVRGCAGQPTCTIQLWPNDGISYMKIDNGRVVSSLYPAQLPPIAKAPMQP
ncbi:hypothetical protein [Rhizobium sp. RHZ01]|uniref:hypothetical protein n=1 Tax=Rhizobium sp. RHZ01 TaxID=2769304 RepID=UPI00177B4BD2|nr:hypothetical protein [Rhizobium sp. RHZ01]MBD9449739.1 hypothetical protein [Rhizobium sp. RHZ01]